MYIATMMLGVGVVVLMYQIDEIVNGLLYYYGLQFNYEWAVLYWTYIRLGLAFAVSMIGIILFCAIMDIMNIRKAKPLEKPAIRLHQESGKASTRETNLQLVIFALFISGILSIAASIIYSSSILAFIGLGLIFWGALLLFIRPKNHIGIRFVDSVALSMITTFSQIIADLGYRGKAVYLPPKYSNIQCGGKTFVSSREQFVLPPADKTMGGKIFMKTPEGICFVPPGSRLADLYEDEIGVDFTKTDLKYLQEKLPEIFVESLEIAKGLEINIEGDAIHVKIVENIFNDLCKKVRELPNAGSSIGCPLCSSVAVVLAKVTDKPITIEKSRYFEDRKTVEVYYRVVEPEIESINARTHDTI